MNVKSSLFYLILFSLFIQPGFPIDIAIYNQNMAYIQDHASLQLNSAGDVSFDLTGLPENTVSSSILVESDCVDVFFHQLVYKPATLDNILESFIGKNIQLVRYGDDGNIASSRDGLLLSTHPKIIFNIDGKIAVNPPYKYLFPNIPDEITDVPTLQCQGKAESRNCDVDFSYITPGFDWSASYSITLDAQRNGTVEAWFIVKNQTRQDYEDVDLTLASGDISFARESRTHSRRGGRGVEYFDTAMVKAGDTQPEVVKITDYVTFKLPYKVSLPGNQEKQFRYLFKKDIPVKLSYRLEHDIGYRSFRETHVEDVPVTATYTLKAEDLGEHHQPAGLVRIYEKTEDQKGSIFVGSGNVSDIPQGGEFKIDTGRTQDISATYTMKNIDTYQSSTSFDISVVIVNSKDKDVTIDMIERFPARQKDWGIRKKSHHFEKTDARTAEFTVTIPANSTETVSFTADLEN